MGAYTVTAVADQVRDWQSTKGGPMKSYRVSLKDGQGNEIANVEWARKADSPKPEVGQSIDCDIDTSGQYGPKLKLAQPMGGGGGGGFSRSKPPEERRSIAMQHAQKCAVTILEVAAAHGEYKPPNAGDVVRQVKTVAAALFAQVMEAEGGQA